MLENQRTIANPVSIEGIGLHTGCWCKLTFCPAVINSGVRFVRIDLPHHPEIPADIEHVVDITRGTTLGIGSVEIHTVEHVLASIAGLEIDNIIVEVDAEEPPVVDGSAQPFVKILKEAGFVEQASPKDYLSIDETLTYSDPSRNIDIVVMPSDEFRITFMVDYQNPALGTQYSSMYNLGEFETEFAAARTFCFLSEVEMLRRIGLAKGGNLSNAVVIIDKELDAEELVKLKEMFNKDDIKIGKKGILNDDSTLRFYNEPVRHKVLDLIGDLSLLGVPLKAHILAARSGHSANVELVKKLRSIYRKKQIRSKYSNIQPGKFFFDSKTISEILPHRFPFLLVDRIIDMEPGKHIVGIKNVSINEPFFQGHFPGLPIMPGVLIIEAMAQVGGFLLLNSLEKNKNKFVLFSKIEEARFRKSVFPGDQIRFEVDLIKYRLSSAKIEGKAFVNDDLVCEAVLTAAVVDKPGSSPDAGSNGEE